MNQKVVLALLGLLSVVLAMINGATLTTIIFIAIMAFLQNVAYGLQSRAGLRDSNLYHLIAIFVASLVFFATFRYLIVRDLPFLLLPAYLIGTCYGTLKGNKLSQFIEDKIGARIGNIAEKGSNQLLRFWPSILLLILVTFGQSFLGSYSYKIIFLIAVLSLVDSFFFALLRITRNANHYTIHYVASLIQVLIKFVSLKILVDQKMNWYLLMPQISGGAIGSIVGSEYAKNLLKKFHVSFDSHLSANTIKIAKPEMIATIAMFIPQLWIFGYETLGTVLALMLAATLQSISFTNVSRARQRSNEIYLLWSSVFSNGIWFLTAHLLVVNNLPAYLFIPYAMGTLFGGMIGQYTSMKIEKMFNIKTD